LRRGATAGIAHIGDHEGHVGDVARAEQEVTGQIDQHGSDGEFDRCGVGNVTTGAKRRQQ
jgi:hypothetical protein